MSSNLDILWENCLEYIRQEMNDELFFSAYLENSKLYSIDGNIAYIMVEGLLEKGNLDLYIGLIEKSLLAISESNFKAKIITEADLDVLKNENLEKINNYSFDDNLNKDQIFENFIVGLSNEESYKAAVSASNKPGQLFNPLFIYGKPGLGKTHLIHSIGNRIKELRPNMRVLYVSGEEFFNDYIKITKNNDDNEWFNQKYREIDVLLVDDIQFLKNKEKTNEMFFNVYNNLFNKNKQIIIASDVMPDQLQGLEERLVSRFKQGLSVTITPPEFDTCLKILKKKLPFYNDEDDNIITDEALVYIAKNFSSDVRELEGALKRMIFYAITFSNGKEMNMSLVYEAFKDHKSLKTDGNITDKQIRKTVCSYYNLTESQIIGKSRQKKINMPRQIAIYLTRTILETSYDKIGKLYGDRDHSTIMSAYHKIKEKMDSNDGEYVIVISELKKLLKK